MKRPTWTNIAPDRRVNRQTYVDTIVGVIQQVQETARQLAEQPSSSDEVRDHLIVLTGGTGVGKTILLEMLIEELPHRIPCRIAGIINIKALVDAPNPSMFNAALLQACEQCAGRGLAQKSLPQCSFSMIDDIIKNDRNPVIALLDDLETLNNPLFRTDDPVRDQRVLDVKNLLLRSLLQLFHVPVIIIVAARAMPGEPLPYLSEIEFQDALCELPIKNTDEEVNRVLGVTTSDYRTQNCGGSLLVAAVRGPSWHNSAVVRELIDEFMRREPASQRDYFEHLLTDLSHRTPTNAWEIIQAAQTRHLPADLQQRITARLVASSYLVNDGAAYQVYPPLADLLRSI